MHAHIHPSSTWFALRRARDAVDQRFQARSPALVSSLRAITVPRAPLPLQGVTPQSVTFPVPEIDITRSSSLIWAHAPDQHPLAASVYRLCHASWQVAASPCWELAFPDVISSIFLWVLGPVPRRAHPVHALVSSRTTSASPQSQQVRRAGISTMTATSMMATVFGAAVIRSCSGSHTCEASRLLLPRQLCNKP